MTRLLFLGDLAATGFGTVTIDLGGALLDLGEDVRFFSLNEAALSPDVDERIVKRTFSLDDVQGWLGTEYLDQDASEEILRRIEGMFTGALFSDGWQPEAALIVGDVGSLEVSPVLDYIPDGFPVYHYVPIEGDGLPPRWAHVWRKTQPVAMSKFGADQIELVTGTRPPVIYHGVHTDAFWPVSPAQPITLLDSKGIAHRMTTKDDCKRFIGIDPRTTLLFRADRVMPRKMYASLFRSLAYVLARHPDAFFLYHCRTFDEGGHLENERSKYPPAIAGRMASTGLIDKGFSVPRKLLNVYYNAADAYVTSSAEGFGLCIAESLSCGVPAVGMDYSSVPEVIGPAGVTVPVGARIDNVYGHYWARPNERAFAEAVEHLVTHPAQRRELGAFGPIHVRRNFTWPKAAAQFQALLPVREAVAA